MSNTFVSLTRLAEEKPARFALHPDKAGELKAALASYLAVIPDSDGKLDRIKVGEAAAAKVLKARVHDGADAPDT